MPGSFIRSFSPEGQRYMHDPFLVFLFHREAAPFEHGPASPRFPVEPRHQTLRSFGLRNPGEVSEGEACDAETLVVFPTMNATSALRCASAVSKAT